MEVSGVKKLYLDANDNDITTDASLANTITKVRLKSTRAGSLGNSDRINVYQAQLSHYDVDFNKWFSENPGASIPEDLDGKGFRWYCATDTTEWFNIIFRSDMTDSPPESGNSEVVIKSINIDVSNVTDAKSLVNAIVEQAQPILTGSSSMNHYYRVAKKSDDATSSDAGVLTVYDSRTFNVSTLTNLYQKAANGSWRGARIADGVLDDVLQSEKQYLYINRLKIHDTDKASMNLSVQIPDMRLKSMFSKLDSGKSSIYDYSLNSKTDRNALLGNDSEQGLLDNGIEYLLDAAVMVGAQRARLDSDQSKLVVQSEDELLAEIVLSNADLAKEMTDYTKANVLTQAAQAILAQANQNLSSVLSLLQ